MTFAAMALLALAPALAHADTFTVTTTEDEFNDYCDAETCTLRDAITIANYNGDPDTIIVPAGLYELDEGRLDIYGQGLGRQEGESDLTLLGAGADRTIIDGGGDDRVLKIHDGAVADVSGFTLRGGYYYSYGGGVRVNGELTLTDSVVSFNATGGGDGYGGGIANYGSLTLNRVLVARNGASGDGGGLYNYGTAEIVDSTFDSNTSDSHGGAIYSYGPLAVTRSALTRNGSQNDGGALYVDGYGEQAGPATLTNSTVSGNDANINLGSGQGGAIYVYSGLLDITSSTIARNQSFVDSPGGIATGNGEGPPTVVTVQNTIVAENRGEQQYENRSVAGESNCSEEITFKASGRTVLSNGNNLESGDDCGFDGPGDLQNADAGLAPLAGHGGPTETHALLSSSDALEAANAEACPDLDQRGGERPPPSGSAGAACDIGAFEAGSLADLRLAFKSAAPSPATVGQRLTYTVLAVNDGPDAVSGARVTDDLPGGLTFVSASSTSGSCSGTDVVVCDLGPLASGASALITIVVEPTAAGVLSNAAAVGAVVTDVEHENDTATVDVAVNAAGAPPATPIVPPTLNPPRLNLSTRTDKVTLDGILKGIVASGGCSDGCSLRFRLLVQDAPGSVELARFNRVLARSYAGYSTETRTVRLRPCANRRTGRQSPTCLKRLRRGLKGVRRFTARVEATATGKDGQKTRKVRRLRVRR